MTTNKITQVKNREINKESGVIVSIDGPVIGIEKLEEKKVSDLVKIGHKKLMGEIIKIIGNRAIAQCYDTTDGLKIGEPVINTNEPLSMELAPGLLDCIFDGIQRPLAKLGDFIESGIEIKPLNRTKKWEFLATKKPGDEVKQGDIIGTVQETQTINHKIMVPIGVNGVIESIKSGSFTIIENIYSIKDSKGIIKSYPMLQKWPIRDSRPYKNYNYPNTPLITGMRVIDLLYPVARGGAVAIPGGFGTGKTVTQHTLAKFADANIIVYIGCGERGNEMADILQEFPSLEDPRTGRPIMERTVLIGNTSNMPVSAREASIFSGLTMAEYYRDMGYNICLLADSTSRWAEALRELSGRLEEMPAEGGYPAYLATRLANFYERAGTITPHGSPDRRGSVTLVGAVSPPSGDFSEPVTKTTKRFIRGFWALDAKLAYSRHYPAINWTNSYSLYDEYLTDWWSDNIGKGWSEARAKVSAILSKSDDLQNIVQIMGKENLPAEQQLILFTAELIKQAYLIQGAFDEIDRYSSPEKTLALIKTILHFHEESKKVIKFIPISEIRSLAILTEISRAKTTIKNKDVEIFEKMNSEITNEFQRLIDNYRIINNKGSE